MKRTALARKTPLKRKPMRRKPRSTKYSRRERDTAYMGFVKTLRCSAKTYSMPWRVDIDTECGGGIEADHMGPRGLSNKAKDSTCAPMCSSHHRERTDHSGVFKHATQAQIRAWRMGVIARTYDLYVHRILPSDVLAESGKRGPGKWPNPTVDEIREDLDGLYQRYLGGRRR